MLHSLPTQIQIEFRMSRHWVSNWIYHWKERKKYEPLHALYEAEGNHVDDSVAPAKDDKSLSKCSSCFGGHSVVKILASQFEFDDTLNVGPRKQFSNDVSCLSWCFFLCQEMVKKGFFFVSSELALSNFRKQILPFIIMYWLNVSVFWNAWPSAL